MIPFSHNYRNLRHDQVYMCSLIIYLHVVPGSILLQFKCQVWSQLCGAGECVGMWAVLW